MELWGSKAFQEIANCKETDAILGRIACYSGAEVTWDAMLGSNQSYQGAIDLSRLWRKCSGSF